jgi:hypothetical protein
LTALKFGKGPCCSDADGSVVADPDWESNGGHYRVCIDNATFPMMPSLQNPNRVGRTMVWPTKGSLGIFNSLLHAGQHDVIRALVF